MIISVISWGGGGGGLEKKILNYYYFKAGRKTEGRREGGAKGLQERYRAHQEKSSNLCPYQKSNYGHSR